MLYIEAPDEYHPQPHVTPVALFLAGGITGTRNWQNEMVRMLSKTDLIVLNPRRQLFPKNATREVVEEQIIWEYRHLHRADAILFWFPPETVCPIALYELGCWARDGKRIFVGTHPDYPREQDVEIQLRLARPDVKIVHRISDLVDQVIIFFGKGD
jgi:hypothetical protein